MPGWLDALYGKIIYNGEELSDSNLAAAYRMYELAFDLSINSTLSVRERIPFMLCIYWAMDQCAGAWHNFQTHVHSNIRCYAAMELDNDFGLSISHAVAESIKCDEDGR